MRHERAWPQQCWKSCANGSNIVALTMLGVVGWKVWPVSNFAQQHAATCNNMQQGVQTSATCNIQQCWELLVNNVASVCTQPNAKTSRFRPNRNLKGTIYHWSEILRSFSVVSSSARPSAMQTDFSRFFYSPRIVWFGDRMNKNQKSEHAQTLDTVPLRKTGWIERARSWTFQLSNRGS